VSERLGRAGGIIGAALGLELGFQFLELVDRACAWRSASPPFRPGIYWAFAGRVSWTNFFDSCAVVAMPAASATDLDRCCRRRSHDKASAPAAGTIIAKKASLGAGNSNGMSGSGALQIFVCQAYELRP
jgi:hypothetical protein